MVAGVCFVTTATSNLMRDAQLVHTRVSSPACRGGGCPRASRKRDDTKKVCCKNSNEASITRATNLGKLSILSRELDCWTLGGNSLVRSGCRRAQRQDHGQGLVSQGRFRMCYQYNEARKTRRFSKSSAFGQIGGVERRIRNGLQRKRQSRTMGGGDGFCACRRQWQWRVRATEEADGDPFEEGYWDGAEGKQQLDDIEAMQELIAEAESLRKAESTERGSDELTPEETEKQRTEKLREELARRAKQQAEQRKQAEIMFGMGQRAYGRGVYDKSVQLLEAALSNVPTSTHLGGEIQIWLAMAYEANNRHGDCIALYRRIEATHPNKKLRRQAADLRYILEAPKLKISREEMVSIPIIERDYDRGFRKSWRQQIRDRRQKPAAKSKSKDYLEDWLVWDPPRWERSPYFWVAVTVWLTLVGVSLMFQD